jgi:hypothetical protein
MAKQRSSTFQPDLPRIILPEAAVETGSRRRARIPHQQILRALSAPEGPGDLVRLYREKVVPIKTRTIVLLGRKSQARIIHTLLGFEVLASYKRIQCPDMVTARYVKLFTDLGCHSIKLPYDPTVTAVLIPEFEAAVERMAQRVRELFPSSRATQLYVMRQLLQLIRPQLRAE